MIQTPLQRSSLEVLRAKIIEAVPDILEENDCECDYCKENPRTRHIQLADVLRAIDVALKSCNFKGYLEDGYFGFYNEEHGWMKWNLLKSLDDQPQPVIDFLTTILV